MAHVMLLKKEQDIATLTRNLLEKRWLSPWPWTTKSWI